MLKKIVKKLIRVIKTPFILADFYKFKKIAVDGRFSVRLSDFQPQLFDKTSKISFDRHYLYHPAWAARVVSRIMPKVHVDISSILHFGTIVSAFVPVKFYDYRPANIELPGYTSDHADLLDLPFESGSVECLSCMHTVEHVGLGRYGDPQDADGDLKAIKELKRVLSPGGNLLFVVPIGQPKIEFNAHRIYSYAQIMEYFDDLELKEFTLISEMGGAPIVNATEEQANAERYGCGCFWFNKTN
jgi:SAM-dependent methyltransferase